MVFRRAAIGHPKVVAARRWWQGIRPRRRACATASVRLAALGNPLLRRVNGVVLAITAILVVLAAINAIFITQAAVLDAQRPSALARLSSLRTIRIERAPVPDGRYPITTRAWPTPVKRPTQIASTNHTACSKARRRVPRRRAGNTFG